MHTRRLFLLLALAAGTAQAETPADFLNGYAQDARATNPDFRGFSAQNGEQFFKTRHRADWSCASCHTDRPSQTGRHATTGKRIEPLAPPANAKRFTDRRHVEKWFKRNCYDVLDRACTTQEKGDVLSYLMSAKP